jgi:nitrous oxide reductase accessory protein NosL
MTQPGQQQDHPEGEFYVEPAKLTRKAAMGVVLALLALTVIGVGGYIWLNPNLSVSELMARRPDQAASPGRGLVRGSASVKPIGRAEAPASAKVNSDLTAAANADRQAECPQCGMMAGASEAEVVAQFGEGSVSHFDSWVCVFGWSKAQGQPVQDAVVLAHGSTRDVPRWLTAADSSFLYDTKRIAGSMPPYVAAFGSATEADNAQADQGGRVVNWTELQQQFQDKE